MNLGCRGLSSNALRSSEMVRARTSSVTNESAHTVFRSSCLATVSPGRDARHTSTSITFGSRRTALPFKETVFSVGWTSHVPTRKSPFKLHPPVAQNSVIIPPKASSKPETPSYSSPRCIWEFLRPSEARNDEEGHPGIRTNNAAAEGTCSTRFAKPKCGGVSLVKRSVGSPKLFSSLPKTCLVRLSICFVGRLYCRSTHTGGRVARVGGMISLRSKVPNEAHSLDCGLSFTSGAESYP